MTRTFLDGFDPASASPISGATVSLDVSEIEDAGIREVLHTPAQHMVPGQYSTLFFPRPERERHSSFANSSANHVR